MARPLIGITCDGDSIVDRRGSTVPRQLLQSAYVDAIAAADADPILLPTLPAERAAALVARLDALVISGGDFDVPPDLYGQSPHPKLGGVNPARSAFERAALLAALERNLPVLGVCGGMQLLNVTLGGSLFQDLSLRPNTDSHQQPHEKRRPHHPVDLEPNSHLGRLLGAQRIEVNSTHHQVVDTLGRGLRIAGRAPDGAVEAIELERGFVLGVQWHPEALEARESPLIYAGLARAAAERAQNPSK